MSVWNRFYYDTNKDIWQKHGLASPYLLRCHRAKRGGDNDAVGADVAVIISKSEKFCNFVAWWIKYLSYALFFILTLDVMSGVNSFFTVKHPIQNLAICFVYFFLIPFDINIGCGIFSGMPESLGYHCIGNIKFCGDVLILYLRKG